MNLDIKQKIALAGLFVVAMFVVIIGIRGIRSTIYGADYKEKKAGKSIDYSNLEQDYKANANIEIKLTDTDGDELTDWDELNVYNTSPYIPDSDSDGILDGVEVQNNLDPTCHNQKVCDGLDQVQESTVTSEDALSNEVDAATQAKIQAVVKQFDKGFGSANNIKIDVNNLPSEVKNITNPDDLRRILEKQGMSKAILEMLSNEDLMKTYNSLINK